MSKVSWHVRYASGGNKKQSPKDFIQYYYLNNWYIQVLYDENEKPKWYQSYDAQGKKYAGATNLNWVKEKSYEQMLIESHGRVIK